MIDASKFESYALNSEIDAYNFDLSQPVPIAVVAPFLRRNKPIIRELNAFIGDNNGHPVFQFDAPKSTFARWRFPLDPGFRIFTDGKMFISTRVRFQLGSLNPIVDAEEMEV